MIRTRQNWMQLAYPRALRPVNAAHDALPESLVWSILKNAKISSRSSLDCEIWERNGPSLETIQPLHPHEPVSLKFKDRPQEETKLQERWARTEAWDLAKQAYNIPSVVHTGERQKILEIRSPTAIFSSASSSRSRSFARLAAYGLLKKPPPSMMWL